MTSLQSWGPFLVPGWISNLIKIMSTNTSSAKKRGRRASDTSSRRRSNDSSGSGGGSSYSDSFSKRSNWLLRSIGLASKDEYAKLKTAQFVARNGPEFEQRILCAMLNPQSCPQPQTPALTPPRTRCPHVRHSTHSQP